MIELIHGDITPRDVDAIVNAANTSLLGGGGVHGEPELLASASRIDRHYRSPRNTGYIPSHFWR